jgi:hypothetical protein
MRLAVLPAASGADWTDADQEEFGWTFNSNHANRGVMHVDRSRTDNRNQ